MTKTLYVGNLPWETSEEELAQAFSACCEVISCRIITDRETGRSRGFGFVEIPEADLDRAVEMMNGQLLSGRPLKVNEAQPRQSRF